MEQRRRFWKLNFTIQIFNFALIAITALFLIIFYALWRVVAQIQYSLMWQIYLIILQLSFSAFFLILLIIMFIILHRTLGPIPRIEQLLDRVINGDRSLRINVRKRDIIRPFVDKLNKVLDLLEQNTKG